MTYSTPELLLVGAAQSIVLAAQEPSDAPFVCHKDVDDASPLSDTIDSW